MDRYLGVEVTKIVWDFNDFTDFSTPGYQELLLDSLTKPLSMKLD